MAQQRGGRADQRRAARPRRAEPLRAAPRRSRHVRALLELPLLVAVALVVTLLVKGFLAQAFFIPTSSMEPQLRQDDRIVVSRTAYRLHDPRRGDIVVFPSPEAPPEDHGLIEGLIDDVLDTVAFGDRGGRDLIKRVVGLPGEVIEGRGSTVWVDGRRLVEPYLAEGTVTGDFGPLTVPDDAVFVMGDNRTNSRDSRFPAVGPIPVDSIVGRAIARVWPPWRVAFL